MMNDNVIIFTVDNKIELNTERIWQFCGFIISLINKHSVDIRLIPCLVASFV